MRLTLGFCVSLFVTIVIGSWINQVDAPLRKAGYDILAFELSWSPTRSGEILQKYRKTAGAIQALQASLFIDSVLFIPAYTISLYLGCWLAYRSPKSESDTRRTRVRRWMPIFSLVAGALDYVENLGLWRQSEVGGVFWWLATFVSSVTKWILIVVVCLYGLGALTSAIRAKIFVGAPRP
jgi:hypothetical protein